MKSDRRTGTGVMGPPFTPIYPSLVWGVPSWYDITQDLFCVTVDGERESSRLLGKVSSETSDATCEYPSINHLLLHQCLTRSPDIRYR